MIELVQEINESGILEVLLKKNVIFTSRKIQDVSITDDGNCLVNIVKLSDQGSIVETVLLSAEKFNERVETNLWAVIDEERGEN